MATCTECIWRDYHEGLLGFIRSRVADVSAADDILQDVFSRIHAHIGGLKDESSVQSWIYRIARNALIDYYRTNKILDELPDSIAAPEVDPGDKSQREIEGCVLRLIQELPELYRDALTMSEIEGLTQRETADRLGISLPGAKSRIQRGREFLRNLLDGCCHFEFDHRGTIIEFKPKSPGCECEKLREEPSRKPSD